MASFRKTISAKIFNEVRLKKVGRKFYKDEMYAILTEECGLLKSHYLVKRMVEAKLIFIDKDGKYYFDKDCPATDYSLTSTMKLIKQDEKPKGGTHKLTEEKAIEFLKKFKNTDGSDKYIIQKFVPATYETL